MVGFLLRHANRPYQEKQLRELLAVASTKASTPKRRPRRQVQRRLSAAEVAELVAGYHAGQTVYQLARQFGIKRATVSRHLEQAGVQRRRQPLTPAAVDQALRWYQGGQSASSIARQLGCDPDTVRRALRKEGVALRDRTGEPQTVIPRHKPPMSPDEIIEAVALYTAGHAVSAIASRLTRSPSTIWKALTRAGVVMRDSRGR